MAFFGRLPDLTLHSRIDYWPVLEESSMMAITRQVYQACRSAEYMEDFLSYSRVLSTKTWGRAKGEGERKEKEEPYDRYVTRNLE